MYQVVPPFELDDQVIKKAIAFGSVAALSALESDYLIADDSVTSDVEEVVVTATKRE